MKAQFTSKERVEIFLAVGDKLRIAEQELKGCDTDPIWDDIREYWMARIEELKSIRDKAMNFLDYKPEDEVK